MRVWLKIDNIYPAERIKSEFAGEVPDPPTLDEDDERYRDWAYDHIYAQTGTGREHGDAGYFVTVVAASVPEMVGREFEWGT